MCTGKPKYSCDLFYCGGLDQLRNISEVCLKGLMAMSVGSRSMLLGATSEPNSEGLVDLCASVSLSAKWRQNSSPASVK